MPVSVIVGGQFGSEGKGKVALEWVRRRRATAAIRVGGSNSGHTAIGQRGDRLVFRHLPTGVLEPNVVAIIPAGSYIDPGVLLSEIDLVQLEEDRLRIDPWAFVIEEGDIRAEAQGGLVQQIGSTGSGTGAAVAGRISRDEHRTFAKDIPQLRQYIAPTTAMLRSLLGGGSHVVVEGTQGFGLSLLHSGLYPFVTSRDTTAAGALSEAGLSPMDVSEVVLVIRAFPIRVSGSSGPLPGEMTWGQVADYGGHPHPIREETTVTKKVRRVGSFESEVVRRAISVNAPTSLVLNHLDYLDHEACLRGGATGRTAAFVRQVDLALGRSIDQFGFGPDLLTERESVLRGVNGGG